MAERQHVAYLLLVELLAHQFAFPVQWIDTQDVLLDPRRRVQRIVELGPGSTLANMARRTHKAGNQFADTLLGLSRLFMSCVTDVSQVRYHYQDVTEDGSNDTAVVAKDSKDVPSNVVVAKMEQAAPVAAPAVAVAASSIADVPIPALHMVAALISFKLRKSMDELNTKQSIKELSSGKSTLQNELIGDVGEQFGAVPDGAEDMPLAALADALEPSNSGQLGKKGSTNIGRWVAAVMPPKFALSAIREYLHSTYGLGQSRQTSVLLFAMTHTIASATARASSVDHAMSILDEAVQKYAHFCGLSLQKAVASSASQSTAVVMDPKVIDDLTQTQKQLAHAQYKALAKYLGLEGADMDNTDGTSSLMANFHQRLALWHAEFGPDFEEGLKPIFRPLHLRRYDFCWNQSRNDICRLYFDCFQVMTSAQLSYIKTETLPILASKADATTMNLLSRLILHASLGSSSATFVTVGRTLQSMIGARLSQASCHVFTTAPVAPRTLVLSDGAVTYSEVPRTLNGATVTYSQILRAGEHAVIKTQVEGHWSSNKRLTDQFFSVVDQAQGTGLSFAGKVVLVTGAGRGSIGSELVKTLLGSGARVIVTTSRSIASVQAFYRRMYSDHASRGAELFLLPFNQASLQDCEALAQHIYNADGLGLDIDVIIPFAAMPEGAADIDQLSWKSELAHRLMLTNLLRLLGFLVQQKSRLSVQNQPSQVLLPLSPNHGTFGGDGLYSESKLGLEGLLNRFASESWHDKLSICGVIIGWTRGTGLMEGNDLISEAIESHGVLTFSQAEMALNILAVCTGDVASRCEDEALVADFSGGLGRVNNLKSLTNDARTALKEQQQISKAIYAEDARESGLTSQPKPENENSRKRGRRRGRLEMQFPALPKSNHHLQSLGLLDMVDLRSTAVIVGFSELGPWGSARTRWEMESKREFSLNGYIELAWFMGLTRHVDGPLKGGNHYVGWVDSGSGEPVHDEEIPHRYSEKMLQHAGIRMIESELLGGYDPLKKEFLQEISLDADSPEFECTTSAAEALKLRHGDSIILTTSEGSETARCTLKAGSRIFVPKTVPLAYSVVAGLIPTGWSAVRYGVSEDIVRQVDAVTLYTICCVAEAFYSAGIEHPQEVFKYIHLSELGNMLGTSLGGTDKLREMMHDVRLDKDIQGDVLQETNLNTPAAWVNMLLLGASGPIKTPVGACATALESMDMAIDSITTGKTKLCLVGGSDNFQEDESYAFSTMKATVNAAQQFAEGRTPREFSRPTADTRAGFLEAQGCGVQIVCNAELAIEMGLPIYAVIAGTTMAADQISRSVPAPGKGLLTFAREDDASSPMLDLKYRRAQMQMAISRASSDSDNTTDTGFTTPGSGTSTPLSIVSVDSSSPDKDAAKQSETFGLVSAVKHKQAHLPQIDPRRLEATVRRIRRQWGNDFRADNPRISPMRAALAVWGLTIDDLDIVSLHGTSTKANDINEPETINTQMTHLNRNSVPLLSICQKAVTGHPKAPAAAWMLNGCLQSMCSGIVPGNPNCDNIDRVLQKYQHLAFPTESLQLPEIKAFLLNSFGFGQKGAQMVGVNPKYLFATLEATAFETYASKCRNRQRLANRAFAKAVLTNSIVKAQTSPPYRKEDAMHVLMDPMARAELDTEAGAYVYKIRPPPIAGALLPEMHQWAETQEERITVEHAKSSSKRLPPVATYAAPAVDPLVIISPGSEMPTPFGNVQQRPLLEFALGKPATERPVASPLQNIAASLALAREPTPAELEPADSTPISTSAAQALSALVETVPRGASIGGVGVDWEDLTSFTSDANPTFLDRNYTKAEREHATHARDPHAYYVSRWCAKEAVFKCLAVKSQGAGFAMEAIEIVNDEKGVPGVKLHGAALEQAQEAKYSHILLSISYGNDTVIAVAVSQRAAQSQHRDSSSEKVRASLAEEELSTASKDGGPLRGASRRLLPSGLMGSKKVKATAMRILGK
ncbi:hypothetical protein BAUCODRAFT_144102 [Baudoinia panamericana UAMH 10762]|uniref:Ketosynthase family 3 (KS3) domain-containing protein n=1 Tax=Baudoinia panamericana (strain UAMH 10762) TaxID=717646 RepID=M2MU33_BAUPA|nr:uncharacterized protein BAUCODRAFT_144102 [Baudoinia panamericana UAMH 10762]EMD00432.1 hypothetical protein BAUCODRAFT_144102 [Baudoinia panamericana UAMH 10762]